MAPNPGSFTISLLPVRELTDIEGDSEETPFISEKIEPVHIVASTRILHRFNRVLQHAATHASQLDISWLLTILPSFVRNRGFSPITRINQKNATLDGLRGLACFFVFCAHFTNYFTQSPHSGWNGTPGRNHIVQWPVIRLVWSGSAWVAVFFVISGYVLSYKPIRMMRKGDFDIVYDTLTSSIFRRGIRLYLPTVIAFCIAFILTRLGLFIYPDWIYNQGGKYVKTWENLPPTFDTFSDQLFHFYLVAREWVSFWKWGNNEKPIYDVHLWTIPYEFCSSMLIFLMLTGTARLRPVFRISIICGIIAYCIDSDQEIPLLFIAGSLLAEIDLVILDMTERGRQASTNSHIPPTTCLSFGTAANKAPLGYLTTLTIYRSVQPFLIKTYLLLIFFVSLFFLSTPNLDASTSTFYTTLTSPIFVPSTYTHPFFLYHSLGAILLVHCATQSSTAISTYQSRPPTRFHLLRRILQTPLPIFLQSPPIQYLGSISYALYIVHGNVMKVFLYPMMPWLYGLTNAYSEDWKWYSAIGVSILVHWPIQFWAADLFWRGVDRPSVEIGRWVERLMRV